MRTFLVMIAFLLGLTPALAQDATAYFHKAAGLYCFGDLNKSKEVLAEGLKKYPRDPKLQQLKRKLDEQQKKSEQKKKQEEERKKEEQRKKQEQKKREAERQKEEQRKKQEQQQKEDEQRNGQRKKQPASQQEQPSSDQGPREQRNGGQAEQSEEQQSDQQHPAPMPSKLTQQQAENMLRALQQDEQKLQGKMRSGRGTPVNGGKDW